MNDGVALWRNIIESFKSTATEEDKIIHMIHLYSKTCDVSYFCPFSILLSAIEKKKFKCARWIIDSGLVEDIEREMKYVFRYWKISKDILSTLFQFGLKFSSKSIVLSGLSKTERRDAMKKITFLEKLKSGGNNARRAALTMLAIIRFRRNEHMANCINMDVMRMIARMIYESGAKEWKVWKTSRRKSNRLQKKRRIKE